MSSLTAEAIDFKIETWNNDVNMDMLYSVFLKCHLKDIERGDIKDT